MTQHYDVIVCGAGPSGLTSAAYLAKAGLSVAVCEQAPFPRHQIGESLLPFSWRVFDDIGFSDKLKNAGFVEKYGACFHSQRSDRQMTFRFDNSVNPLFSSIYHVDRERFDQLLLDHVAGLGVTVYQPHTIRSVVKRDDGQLEIDDEFTCRLLVRASGITTQNVYPQNYVPNSPDDNATGIYSYFHYKPRSGAKADGDILIDLFYKDAAQRMPSWAWAIPISSSIMSVGFVLRTHHFAAYRRDGLSLDQLGRELLRGLPFIEAAIDNPDAALEPYRMRFNFQRVAKQIVFDREVLIGDAAGFIDPVFSSGVHIALNSARLSSPAIVAALSDPQSFNAAPLYAFQDHYRKLFWTYYRFVKTFYEKNLVENFFLVADPLADERSQLLAREFTSILSGDVEAPNSIVRALDNARLNINPEVSAVFNHSAAAAPTLGVDLGRSVHQL